MRTEFLARIMVALGIIAALVAVLADPLGLGHEGSGFGWKQVVALVVGVVLVLGGIVLQLRQSRAPAN